MIASIFGDLAACTFKQDRKLFERQLVGEDAFLSDKGILAMATIDAIFARKITTIESFKDVIYEYYEDRDKEKVHFPKWFRTWCTQKDIDYTYDSDDGMSLPLCCVTAHFDQELSVKLHHHLLGGKASGYAAHIFTDIIQILKNDKSKKRVLQEEQTGMFSNWIKNDFMGDETFNALHSLILAWKAFDASYDFTSAIKNAAIIGEYCDTRVITMLSASMAGIYYNIDSKNVYFPSHIYDKYKEVLSYCINKQN